MDTFDPRVQLQEARLPKRVILPTLAGVPFGAPPINEVTLHYSIPSKLFFIHTRYRFKPNNPPDSLSLSPTRSCDSQQCIQEMPYPNSPQASNLTRILLSVVIHSHSANENEDRKPLAKADAALKKDIAASHRLALRYIRLSTMHFAVFSRRLMEAQGTFVSLAILSLRSVSRLNSKDTISLSAPFTALPLTPTPMPNASPKL